MESELASVVGREMWRDVWGEFVDLDEGDERWWWEDEEILQECRERGTVFECRTIFACREGGEE